MDEQDRRATGRVGDQDRRVIARTGRILRLLCLVVLMLQASLVFRAPERMLDRPAGAGALAIVLVAYMGFVVVALHQSPVYAR